MLYKYEKDAPKKREQERTATNKLLKIEKTDSISSTNPTTKLLFQTNTPNWFPIHQPTRSKVENYGKLWNMLDLKYTTIKPGSCLNFRG